MDLPSLFASNHFTRAQVDLLRAMAAQILVRPPITVAALGAPVAGSRDIVTDATATTFASVVAGGGANTVPVYADGSAWRIG